MSFPIDDALASCWGFPAGTRGVLIERILEGRGARGGRRERVAYVSVREAASTLRRLPAGRYRVAAIGSRGVIAGGACVMEKARAKSAPQLVAARTPRQYERARPPRRTKDLPTPRRVAAEPHPAVAECKSLRRKVSRRDGQITREREAHDKRERVLRAELRTSRAVARRAKKNLAAAVTYAEQQQQARERAERDAARAKQEVTAPRPAPVTSPTNAPSSVWEPNPRVVAASPSAREASTSRAEKESARRIAALEVEVRSLRAALIDAAIDRARQEVTHREEREVMGVRMQQVAAAREASEEVVARWRRRVGATLAVGGVITAVLCGKVFRAHAKSTGDVPQGSATSATVGMTGTTNVAVGFANMGSVDHWSGAPITLAARGGTT